MADPPHLIWDMMKGWVPNPALLALSAYIENDFDTRVMDCTVSQNPWADFEREVAEFKPQVVGLCNIGTSYLYDALNAAKLVKMVSPETKVIIGGTHPSLAPDEVLNLGKEVDFACIGEGEVTLKEFVQAVDGGEKDFSRIKGLAFRDGTQIIRTEPRPFIEDLNSLPMPAYHRVPMGSPLYSIDVIGPKCVVPSFSRGCGYKCTFCTETLRWGNRWRGKSAWKIVEEIEYLQKNFGIKTFLVGDNDFLWDRKRNYEYCELMEKKGLKANLWIQARPDHIMRDRELIPRLRKVGLFEVLLGIESFEQSMMDTWDKREELETILKCIKLLKQNDVMVLTSLMFGHWNDSKETIDKLIKSAKKHSDFLGLAIATPFPGTQFFKESTELGRIEETDYRKFDWGTAVMSTKHLTRKEVGRLHGIAYGKFYVRPKTLIKAIFSTNPYIRTLYKSFATYLFRKLMKRPWRQPGFMLFENYLLKREGKLTLVKASGQREKCDVCGERVGLYSGYRCTNPGCGTLFCMDCNSGGFVKQCPQCGSTAG
jgi:radical SAM superfamily enzyme YgiQ (UPF0313 family)